MFTAIRSISVHKPFAASSLFPTTAITPHNFAGKVYPVAGTLRSNRTSAGAGTNTDMEGEKTKQARDSAKKGDVMSHSFGEGYSTRSDEEGFGGIYGSNQSLSNEDDDKNVHCNSPDYDKSQGSEVREKEKARNQTMETLKSTH